MTARFRPSRPEDSAAIRQFLESSGLSLYSTANTPASGTAGRPDPPAHVEVYVVEADETTVAVLQSRLVADEAEILDIAVAKPASPPRLRPVRALQLHSESLAIAT